MSNNATELKRKIIKKSIDNIINLSIIISVETRRAYK